MRFKHLRNNLLHTVTFDPKANVHERKLVKDINRRHHHSIGFYHSRNKERKNRNRFDRRQGNQAIEGDILLFQESVDDKAYVDNDKTNHQEVEDVMTYGISRHKVSHAIGLHKLDRAVIDIAETNGQRQCQDTEHQEQKNMVAPDREANSTNQKTRIKREDWQEHGPHVNNLVGKNRLVQISGQSKQKVT